MLADAVALKREDDLSAFLRKNADTQNFTLNMLTATSMADKWGVLMAATSVAWGKRLRFFCYAALPWLYMPGMWLKSVLKK